MGKKSSAEQEERRDKLGALGEAPQLRVLPYRGAVQYSYSVFSEPPHIAQQSHPACLCHVDGHTEATVTIERIFFRASHCGLVLIRSWAPPVHPASLGSSLNCCLIGTSHITLSFGHGALASEPKDPEQQMSPFFLEPHDSGAPSCVLVLKNHK